MNTRQEASERRRVARAAFVGLVVALVTTLARVWELSVLVGWIAMSSTLLARVWFEVARLDADGTRRVAIREDDSRAAARLVLVGASTVSLVAVIAALHRAGQSSLQMETALTVAAMASVVVSWLVVHSVYVLKYAHLYYDGDAVGGIEFPGDSRPAYRDFAYVGFTIGMTFQVSDTEISDSVIRSTVLRHALLSYLFGTAIIASTINVLAGVVG